MEEHKTDNSLIELAQNGETKAFEMLVSKYQRRLMGFLYRFVKDEHEANDIAQETMIKAYQSIDNFKQTSSFYTWICSIAINTAKNSLLKTSRHLSYVEQIEVSDKDDDNNHNVILDHNTPEAELLRKEMISQVNLAIEKMPPELAVAIKLREIEGLSYEEIAQVLDCPTGTVRSRIFRAREFIINQLDVDVKNH